MTYMSGFFFVLVVLRVFVAFGAAGQGVTEEEVIDILNGEPRGSISRTLPGFAFSVVFPPPRGEGTAGEKGRAGDAQRLEDEFYKKLIPVGRALESEVLEGYSFAIAVRAQYITDDNLEAHLSQEVAEGIKRFLTGYFAILPDRLTIAAGGSATPITRLSAETTRVPRWRVEIRRLE
jgi:hypothetical protein